MLEAYARLFIFAGQKGAKATDKLRGLGIRFIQVTMACPHGLHSPHKVTLKKQKPKELGLIPVCQLRWSGKNPLWRIRNHLYSP